MNTRRLPKGPSQSTAARPGAKPRGRAPTPAALLRDATTQLRAAGDRAFAQQILTYFKAHERIIAYGVRTPAFREVIRDLHERVRGAWGLGEAVAFAELCLAHGAFEMRGAGIGLLGRFAPVFEPWLLGVVRRWLEADRLDNWAAVDSCASVVVTPLLERYPELVPELKPWHASPNLWVRRMSVVPLVPFARHGRHLPQVYGTVWALRNDPEDLLHKACGWLLRDAGKTDAGRLERFLLDRGAGLPRTTVRYAIERFSPAQRKRLLAVTRAPKGGRRT
jgi:3-methyladenine DNA glycosylase AlkD